MTVSFVNVWPALSSRSGLEPDPSGELASYERIYGYSTEGRAIEGYEFGQGNECLILLGGIHGNEKGTVGLMDRLSEYLIAHDNVVPSDKRVIIVPLVNPDGYYTREDKLNANGVNLNRNFETSDWIKQEDEDDPTTYAGEEPFSEVETTIVRQVAESCSRSVMVSYHSQGGLVSPEDDDASIQLAGWYANKTGYEYYDEWQYAGTATRWLVETTGNPAITVELTNHEDSDWRINKAAILELIGR